MSVTDLPALNALLNLTAAVLLIVGWRFIKAKRNDAHRRTMIEALGTKAAYHAQAGSRPFPGTGAWRAIYFAVLIPHIVLAAAILPLAIVTLRRGLARHDAAHRRIARVTLPIWLFVSVTGVLVDLLLYQM